MTEPTVAGQRSLLWPMLLLVAAYCGWILWLPLFPMQDGPVHLYLAQVLGALRGHAPSIYADYYSVPRLLTPYCVQYYVLILFTKCVSAVVAEKLFVVLIVATQCFGFRYLCRAIGPSGGLYSLFLVGTVLNWPLLMGFQSYALAVALACWALGMWTRGRARASFALPAGFIACCCVILLTHPLPYLLVLAVCGMDLMLSLRALKVDWRSDAGVKRAAVTLGVACLPLPFLWSFARTNRASTPVTWAHTGDRLLYFLGLHGLNFFGGASLAVRLYQAAMVFTLLLGLVVAWHHLWARRRSEERRSGEQGWTPAATWLCVTVTLLFLLLLLPDGFGGSRAIVLRMEPLLWIGALAAASGAPWPRAAVARVFTGLAILSGLLTLGLSAKRLTPVARRIAPVDAVAEVESGKRGLLLTAGDSAEGDFASLLYGPYYWEGVSYFRRTHAVLLNTPWMDSTWLPVRPRLVSDSNAGLLINHFDPDALEFYWKLRSLMIASSETRAQILTQTDFVLFTDQDQTATQANLDAVLQSPAGYRWSCERHDWYVLCAKQ